MAALQLAYLQEQAALAAPRPAPAFPASHSRSSCEQALVDVEVCYAERDRAWRVVVTLPPGATVADAIEHSAIATSITRDVGGLGVAVFGRRASMTTPLVDGDRVELLRPLVVDPAEARRRRAKKRVTSLATTSTFPAKCREQD